MLDDESIKKLLQLKLATSIQKSDVKSSNVNDVKKNRKRKKRKITSLPKSLKEISIEMKELESFLKTTKGYQDISKRNRYEMLKKEYIRRKTNSSYVHTVQGGAPA